MIRITLERDAYEGWNGVTVPAKTVVRTFDSVSEATIWFTRDSYFDEPYTRRATWEVVD
jgi:hypothetical protein